jgi:HNH endonuclease
MVVRRTRREKANAYFWHLTEVPTVLVERAAQGYYYEFLILKYREFFVQREKYGERDWRSYYEYHHIVPVHAGGTEAFSNLIPLTPEDHVLAHQYRYELYGEAGDHTMTYLRKQGQRVNPLSDPQSKAVRMREAQRARQKEKGEGFYNSEVQRKNAQKSLETRRQLGVVYGGKNYYQSEKGKADRARGGYQNQSEALKTFLRHASEWYHVPTQQRVFLESARSSSALADQLSAAVPSHPIQRKHLPELIHGRVRTLHGWQLVASHLRARPSEAPPS